MAEENSQKKEKQQKGKPSMPLPSFVEERMAVCDNLEIRKTPLVEKPIKVTLPDGKVVEGVAGKTTPYEIAAGISKGLADSSVVAKLNGETLWDMFRPLEDDASLELCKFDSDEGRHVYWHSSAHILGQALELKFGAHLCVGPAISEGFYYDVYMEDETKKVSEDDFKDIEKLVNDIVKQKQPFKRIELTKEEALELFKYNPFKVEIINKKVPDGAICTAYQCGPLVDLCRGPHLPTTGNVKTFAVTKNSAAYWLGDANNQSLQRVYGVSFPSKDMMKDYKFRMEEAAKRDHRKVGVQQELFFFHQLSPGSCFFLPHGARIYGRLMDIIKKEYRKRGYEEVVTPNVFNLQLWETSGHAAHYKENMFLFDVEGQQFGMKPMNCPGHCLLFGCRARSYRELPFRIADFGVLHRNELSGALTGLTRVRRFQQDDAHIFCRPDQIKQEVSGVLDFLKHVYGVFGFEFELELSTRPEGYLGTIEQWDNAEKALKESLDEFGRPWALNEGDGAFYGPKIDIKVMDALKRKHQLGTCQLDFQLPQRFGLNYINEASGEEASRQETPVIIHRAILGSVERFFAILLEHTGGKWPFFISPRQVIVVPVGEKQLEYAKSVRDQIFEAGYFVDVDESNRKLPKKIREAQLAQYNYILVVGQEEVDAGTVNIRTRDNVVHGVKPVAELLADFKEMEEKHE
eukprot:CAMPEP_0113874636 /NCGR_PEP_ID=MMETSP0780_2-20120614/4449_1 /TAXON_ID=652834 /ORGANISM="Palpitomonas bilix" /LENGTH=687 /DNA_ID=CAMNT_0000860441 /DNA_START=24 /DNA_END=2087 /DNA_ORIENTATION=- /assembly_acc=CAM_ASM_000599